MPTQTRHPWRATLRTVVAGVVALLPVLPTIADSLGVATVPAVAAALTVLGGVTRVLALQRVDDWLRRFAPWLAASPTTPAVPAGQGGDHDSQPPS